VNCQTKNPPSFFQFLSLLPLLWRFFPTIVTITYLMIDIAKNISGVHSGIRGRGGTLFGLRSLSIASSLISKL
jgi:hypothetical protein